MERDETHQNMKERRLWIRDANFLEKNEGAVGVRKPTIFLLISGLDLVYTFFRVALRAAKIN